MAQTKPGNCFPGFCCLDAHELLFLGGEFLFGDDAGIEEILVLLDLGDGIGGGGRSSRNSRGGNGLAGSGAFLREAATLAKALARVSRCWTLSLYSMRYWFRSGTSPMMTGPVRSNS